MRCPTCGRYTRKGTTHCEQVQGNLFDRAAMLRRVKRAVSALFINGKGYGKC